MADYPLEPLADGGTYRHVVVDLGEYRIQVGRPPVGATICKHTNLIYDSSERRIWCADCSRSVDAFDAFKGIAQRFEAILSDLRVRQARADDAIKSTARQRATKALDHVWAGNGRMAPCCPHCRRGLLPEDFADGWRATISRELEMARRKKDSNHG